LYFRNSVSLFVCEFVSAGGEGPCRTSAHPEARKGIMSRRETPAQLVEAATAFRGKLCSRCRRRPAGASFCGSRAWQHGCGRWKSPGSPSAWPAGTALLLGRDHHNSEVYRPEWAPAASPGLQGELVGVRRIGGRIDGQPPVERTTPSDLQLVGQ